MPAVVGIHDVTGEQIYLQWYVFLQDCFFSRCVFRSEENAGAALKT